ncbi:SDR family NAD(P)-dependent oxidoreductase [Chloroflexota bacterium]
MGRLDHKSAIITGGARGIGKQIALTFANEGADIAIVDIAEMDVVAQEIKGLGRRVLKIKANICNREEVRNSVQVVLDNFQKLDILVNNASIQRRATFLEMTDEEWDAVMNVNVKGVFLCTQGAAKPMIDQKYGKIINMSSLSGLAAQTHKVPVNYSVSKAGVAHLTRVCARELGPYGINVNAIAPGAVVTDMTYDQRTQEEVEQFVQARKDVAALGRIGTTQDMANVALFLASDESSFITGQIIAADGGRYGLM